MPSAKKEPVLVLQKQGKRVARSFLSFQNKNEEQKQQHHVPTELLIRSISNDLNKPHNMQLCACVTLRKLTCMLNPPIGAILKHKPCIIKRLIPLMCAFAPDQKESQLQLEIAWIFSNLLTGNQKQVKHLITTCGIVDAMVHIVVSEIQITKSSILRMQIIWGLGNVAADYFQSPFLIPHEEQIFDLGVKLLANSDCIDFDCTHVVVWLLANMRRARYPLKPSLHHLDMMLPVLGHILETQLLVDPQFWCDACTILLTFFVRDSGENTQIQRILDDGGTLRGVFTCLDMHESQDPVLLCDALNCVFRLANNGNKKQSDILLSLDVLPRLAKSITHRKPSVRTAAFEAIGSIACKSEENFEACMKAGLIEPWIEVLASSNTNDFNLQIETSWLFLDILEVANIAQTNLMISQNLLDALCNMLEMGMNIDDDELMENVMTHFQTILAQAESPVKLNTHMSEIECAGGFDTLMSIADNNSTHCVHALAKELIAEYFEDDCDAQMEAVPSKKKNKNNNRTLSANAQNNACSCPSGCLLKHIGGFSRRLCKPLKKIKNQDD